MGVSKGQVAWNIVMDMYRSGDLLRTVQQVAAAPAE
jgi:hypothetical protein